MTDNPNQLIVRSVLREHRFESHVPVIGPFIEHLRSICYNIAARWGDQSIISQQTAYNQAAVQCIAELSQRIAELDQRIVLADHDLADLTRVTAEMSQHIMELRQRLAQLPDSMLQPGKHEQLG